MIELKNKTPEDNIHIAHDSDPLIIPRRPRSGDSAAMRSSPSNSTGCFCAHTSSTCIGLGFRVYPNPKALRTHISRLLGPKTIPYKALGDFEP